MQKKGWANYQGRWPPMEPRPALRSLVGLLYRFRHPVAAGRQLAEAAQALSEKKFSIYAQPT